MAEEEIKKVRKPRQSKKAAAGTQRTEGKTVAAAEKTAVETAEKPKKKIVRKSVKTAQEEVAAAEAVQPEVAETEVKKVKKQSARKTPKKTEEPAKLAKEQAAQEKPADEKPKTKRTAAKKKTNAVVTEELKKEEPKSEVKAETKTEVKAEVKTEESEPVKQEESQPTEPKAVKAEEITVKTQAKPEAKKETKAEENRPVTRAEKQAERTAKFKPLVLEVLQGGACKRSALVQQAAEKYQQVYGSAEYGNEAGVKGMVGNVLDQMIADKEAFVDGKTVSLQKQAETVQPEMEQKTQKEPTVSALNEEKEEKKDAAKSEKSAEEKEKKNAENVSETTLKTEKTPEKKAEEGKETALTKVEAGAPAPVYDLSALFEKKKPAPKKTEQRNAEPQKAVEEIKQEKAEELQPEKRKTVREFRDSIPALLDTALQKAKEKLELEKKKAKEESPVSAPKADEKGQAKAQPQEKAQAKTQAQPQAQPKTEQVKPQQQAQVKKEVPTRRPARQAKVDPLKEAFLKKLRSLGGNYFEYYAIYLLERYSRMNGRRLEGLRISGGEYDGGIDGELELTDRLGFRETIYVQAKNWEPTDERWWIGETILQQFIGAVAYRQAKEGKQHCRGMFITTSAFTNGAKEMLEKMSDKFVGYDGDDLYETAKECQFGMLLDEKGNWKIDEELLSENKSFFFML